jgi:inner membrane transporter RhtA
MSFAERHAAQRRDTRQRVAQRRPWHAARRGGRLTPAAVLGALPPPALILAGIVSVQVGAGLAKQLFAVAPPVSVTALRLWSSAVFMAIPSAPALWRQRRALLRGDPGGGSRAGPGASGGEAERPAGQARGPDARDGAKIAWGSLGVAAAFGLTLAIMNFAIYQSFARIPLGVAVTIEFLGPLGVAVAASRRLVDAAWVALAAIGVLLLTHDGGHITAAGVAYGLLAAAGWAAYILLSAATGRRFPGSAGLTIAMVVAAIAIAPIGVVAGGAALLRPGVIVIGAGIGLLSSVIPYSLELEALRRMPPRVFGVLMSLEPAVAALVGLVLLGQVLSAVDWLAIACVVAASVGATRGASAGRLEA